MPRPRLPDNLRVELRPLNSAERAEVEQEATAHRAWAAEQARHGRRLGLAFGGLVGLFLAALWLAVLAGREPAGRAALLSAVGLGVWAGGAWWNRRAERGEQALFDASWKETVGAARVVEIDAVVYAAVALDGLLLLDVGRGWWLLLGDEGGAHAQAAQKRLRYRGRADAEPEVHFFGGEVPRGRASFDWTALPPGHPLAEAAPPAFYRAKEDPVAGLVPFEHGWVVREEG